jgi:hypothetical protein
MLDTRIFKFMRRNHMESFFETGVIRLGTVSDFRREEEFGDCIGDQNEGIHESVMVTAKG